MRQLSVLLPFAIVSATEHENFGFSAILANAGDKRQELEQQIITGVTAAIQPRWKEIKAELGAMTEKLLATKSLEEAEALLEKQGDDIEITYLSEAAYTAIAEVISSFVLTNGWFMTEEDKDIEAALLFQAALCVAAEGLSKEAQRYDEYLEQKTASHLMSLIFVDNDDTEDTVASDTDIPEQQTATGESEANTTGDLSTSTITSDGSSEADLTERV